MRADPGEAADRQQQAEHAAGQADEQDLRQVLADDVAAARAERAPQPGERRGVQELREQQAHDVDQAHGEEQQRDADQHAVVLLHDLVAVEPLSTSYSRLFSGRGKRPAAFWLRA